MKKVNPFLIVFEFFYRVKNFFIKRSFRKNAKTETFKTLDGKISSMEQVDVSEFNFGELSTFRTKVETVNNQLVFMGTSKSAVKLSRSDNEKHQELLNRIGTIFDRINSKEFALNRKPYVNPFKTDIAVA